MCLYFCLEVEDIPFEMSREYGRMRLRWRLEPHCRKVRSLVRMMFCCYISNKGAQQYRVMLTLRHIEIPFNDFFPYYGPDYRLDVPNNNMENQNTPQELNKITSLILGNLRNLQHAPSVQMQRK